MNPTPRTFPQLLTLGIVCLLQANSVSGLQVSTGFFHSCAANGTQIKCWGGNGVNELGTGERGGAFNRGNEPGEMGNLLPFVEVGDDIFTTQIVAEMHATCILTDEGRVKCWGTNDNGYLGYGPVGSVGDEATDMGNNLEFIDIGDGVRAREIGICSTGDPFSDPMAAICVITTNDKVKCWGENRLGALGLGGQPNVVIGDDLDEMGDNLTDVDLGTTESPAKIVGHSNHFCVLFDNQRIKCWGQNDEGQLGYGDQTNRGDGANQMGADLDFVDLGTGALVDDVGVGHKHTCALFTNGTVACWGLAAASGFGVAAPSIGIAPSDMGDNLVRLNFGGLLVERLFVGHNHACALMENNEFKCWGAAGFGELGYESSAEVGNSLGDLSSLPGVDLGANFTVENANLGQYSCVQNSDCAIKCFGIGFGGAGIGYGSTAAVGNAANQMGDNLDFIDLGTFGSACGTTESPTIAPTKAPSSSPTKAPVPTPDSNTGGPDPVLVGGICGGILVGIVASCVAYGYCKESCCCCG